MRRRSSIWFGALLALVLVGVAVWFAIGRKSKGKEGPVIVLRESTDAMAALQPRIVDEVKTGNLASENMHQLQGQMLTTGPFKGRSWRGASYGGYIQMVMKVLPDKPMILNCTYWGSEEGPRKFDIKVENQLIATQVLEYNVPGHFFDMEYRIPEQLTQGRTNVTIEFRGHPNEATGGFFGFAILKE